jgi:dienelactone hydrolase
LTLSGTEKLDWEGDLSVRMMDGLHRYIEARIARSPEGRGRFWQRDVSSREAYERSITPNRERFARMIGLVDRRSAPRLERFADGTDSPLVADAAAWRGYQVRWSVLEGVWGEGLHLVPKRAPVGAIVALPDADQTPEQLAGLAPGIAGSSQMARLLAESGFEVLVPALVDRSDTWSGNPEIGFTNQPHREWIYRQAYHMGRHVAGYEVQKVLAAVDWLRSRPAPASRIGVAGYGEGGIVAFYSAAVDARIEAALVSGAFDPHARIWEEPLYRNLFGFLHEFGDAEVASLIAPRSLVVEHSPFPRVDAPPAERQGRRGAAAGKLETPSFESISAEFKRIAALVPESLQRRRLTAAAGGAPAAPGSPEALRELARALGVETTSSSPAVAPVDLRKNFDPSARARRQVAEIERHVQSLLIDSDARRDRLFLSAKFSETKTIDAFQKLGREYRGYVRDELIGRFDEPLLAARPRSRRIYDQPKWTGYEVVLEVLPDVFAWGVLLVPKDLKAGERRPVVVCQHGRGALSRDVIEGDHRAYHDFAARLAERGFITFAPHNPYRGEDRYRFLSRKANAVKGTLFSFILAQHEQILNWLGTLPYVDPARIGFYGLSYGGETAVRIPPLEERYALSICSADFNDWGRKVVSTASRHSFMFTIEWEMPYFDFGRTASYAELASLMIPRPFMVERGHADTVAPDEWVAYEYARVRKLYDQLGLGERTEIEFFDGGHTINGQGTFRFLEKHLRK